MSYVVLARRFRPQVFDQIIGQEHISKTLKNAISENRVAHAYLFSGPRGVGKTTTARILAKALNCKNGPTHEPCDTCPNCKEITAGNSVDVQEIDGASNRGIDEIRALRDNVKFAPASSKYKIYIIDEAHQITDAAFNALLKTLEEPPPHVVFILATTEAQKIPVTILSRCQRYRYRLLSTKEILAHLTNIIKADKLRIDADALHTVAVSAGGSLRDALSLLDQAISCVSGTVTLADVQNLLGFLPQEIIYSTAEALSRKDSAKVLGIIKEVTEQGFSLIQYGRDMREHFRRLLLGKIDNGILEVTEEERKVVEKQLPFFSHAWLIRSGHIISRALDEMRWSEQPRLVLELYMLRLAQNYADVEELVSRLEAIEKGGSFEPEQPRHAPQSAAAPAPAAPVRHTVAQPPAAIPYESPHSVPASHREKEESATSAPASVPGDINGQWTSIVNEVKKEKPLIAQILAEASMKGIQGTQIVLGVTNKFQEEGIKRNQKIIEDVIVAITGQPLGLRTLIEDKKPQAAETQEEIVVEEETVTPPSVEMFQVEEDTGDHKDVLPHGVDKILHKFPGKIRKKDTHEKA